MKGGLFRAVAVSAIAALVAVAVVVLGPRCFKAAAGPEVEVITALKRAEAEGFQVPVLPDAGLAITKASYERLSVRVQPGGEAATVDATLNLEGTFSGTAVSSLGVEEVPFLIDGGDWQASSLAPRLGAVVAALEQRRRALEAQGPGDGGDWPGAQVSHRTFKAERWFLRLERDSAAVTEDWRLEGERPDRPVREQGTRRLTLQRKDSEFFFPEGLW